MIPLDRDGGGEAMIEYKGYVARVEFAESADVFHGRVVNSGPYPIATFESTKALALRPEFQRSIDEYLAVCEAEGIEPKKPFSGKLNLRLGSGLHAAVAMAADLEDVSINTWIVNALRRATTLRESSR